MIKKRQPALHSWFCLLPGQAEDMSEAQMMPQTVVAATPSDAVKEFDPTENFQQCHGCGTYCNLEGMCFRCFTWTCEECAPTNQCPKCKAEINV